MASTEYEKSSSDIDGTTETVNNNIKGRKSEHMWIIVHDLDVNVTLTYYGTHEDDDTFTDGIEIGSTSLTSGGDKTFETLTDPWELFRIELSYSGNPSSGSLTIYNTAER